MDILDLYAKLSLDTSEYEKALKSVISNASSNADALAKSFTSAGKTMSNLGDQLSGSIGEAGDTTENVGDQLVKSLTEAEKTAAAVSEQITAAISETGNVASLAGNEIADVAKSTGNEVLKISEGVSDQIQQDSDESADKQQDDFSETRKVGEEEQKKVENAHKESSEKSANHWSKAGEKIKGALKTAAKISAAAAAAAGAAVVKTVKDAVDAYGEYEQLVGGAKKIFDEMDYSVIAKDAANAYKELNMSASEYIESINLAGASFAQTMGDEKGYNIARKGMMAIADYASGTGKSITELNQKYQLITRATTSYQSIADQFSGILPQTTEDFLNQAQAAGFLSSEYKKLSDVPIAEYQEAVTNMIEKGVSGLGLANNTAKESTETLTGSVAMVKAQWQNLLVALADPNADLSGNITTFVDSIVAMSKNILPVVEQSLNGIASLVEQAVPVILDKVPEFLDSNLPTLVNSIVSVLQSVLNAVTGNADKIAETAVGIVKQLAQFITDNVPLVIQAALMIVITLANGITQMLPELIPAIVGMIETIIATLTDTDILEQLIEAAIKLAVALATGLANSAPKLIAAVKKLVGGIIELILSPEILSQFINAAVLIILAVASAIIQAAPDILTAVFTVIGSIASAFLNADWEQSGKNVVNGIWEGLQKAWSDVETWWTKQWGDIIFALYNFATITIPDTFTKVINYLAEFKTKVSDKASEIVNNFKSYFEELPSKLWSIGTQIVDGLKNGITERWSNLTSTINNKVNNMVSGVKSALRIASPSKVFKEIGEFTAEGFDIGFEDKFNGVSNVINDDVKNVGQSTAGTPGIGRNITVNFNIDKFVNNTDSDIYELADKLSYIFQMRIDNETAVYA